METAKKASRRSNAATAGGSSGSASAVSGPRASGRSVLAGRAGPRSLAPCREAGQSTLRRLDRDDHHSQVARNPKDYGSWRRRYDVIPLLFRVCLITGCIEPACGSCLPRSHSIASDARRCSSFVASGLPDRYTAALCTRAGSWFCERVQIDQRTRPVHWNRPHVDICACMM